MYTYVFGLPEMLVARAEDAAANCCQSLHTTPAVVDAWQARCFTPDTAGSRRSQSTVGGGAAARADSAAQASLSHSG